VTDFSSSLFYYQQSGAINESMSDVFGEYIDLTNTDGNDTAAVRWQIGEDVPGFGAIRNMADPTIFGDPDRMLSPFYANDPSEGDAGGVHLNSGVGNKAGYLMVDGGSFNARRSPASGSPRPRASSTPSTTPCWSPARTTPTWPTVFARPAPTSPRPAPTASPRPTARRWRRW